MNLRYYIPVSILSIFGVLFIGLILFKAYSPPPGQGQFYRTVTDQSGNTLYGVNENFRVPTRTTHNFHTEQHVLVHPGDIVEYNGKYLLVLANGTVREVPKPN